MILCHLNGLDLFLNFHYSPDYKILDCPSNKIRIVNCIGQLFRHHVSVYVFVRTICT